MICFLTQLYSIFSCSFSKENLYIALEKIIPADEAEQDTAKVVIQTAKEQICSYYNVTNQELNSDSRKSNIAYARQMLMYILRNDYNIPLQQIGDNLGSRDHSTVGHGVDKIAEMIKKDALTKSDYEKISKKIMESKN